MIEKSLLLEKLREKKLPEQKIEEHAELLTFICTLADSIDQVKCWPRLRDSVLPFRIIVGEWDFTIYQSNLELELSLVKPRVEKLVELKKFLFPRKKALTRKG